MQYPFFEMLRQYWVEMKKNEKMVKGIVKVNKMLHNNKETRLGSMLLQDTITANLQSATMTV